jgi:type IV pilus assembly protein PilZ
MKDKYPFTIANKETYEDGQVIFKEGSPGDWIFLILSGSVAVSKRVQGKRFILGRLEPGDVIGEIEFISGSRRNLTARAVGQATLGIIDREFLDKEFNELSGSFRKILTAMTRRFEKILERATGFTARTAPRIPTALPVAFQDRETLVRAYTGDLSTGGLFIKTDHPLPPGRQFVIRLRLPGLTEPLQIQCEVVWARTPEQAGPDQPTGMGVKFSQMSTKDSERLRKYLAVEGGEK